MDLFQAYASKRGESASNETFTESLGILLRSKYALDAPDLSPDESSALGKQTDKGIGEVSKFVIKKLVNQAAKATIPKPSRLPFDATAPHSTGLNIVDEVGTADKKPTEFSGAIDSVGRPNTADINGAAANPTPLDLRYSAVSA